MSDIAASSRWLRVAVHTVRTTSTVAGMTLLLGFGALNIVSDPLPTSPSELGMSSGPLNDLMQQNRCSFTGFDKSVIPSTAIVRTPQGETELVSFDQGWSVFRGEEAGELVAVCLGPTAPKPAPAVTR